MTSSGLIAITIWYSILTPLSAKKYAEVQKLEREAAGFAADALSGIKMIAACGAEEKISGSYGKLINEMGATSRKLSPILAVQHAPGTHDVTKSRTRAKFCQSSLRYTQHLRFASGSP